MKHETFCAGDEIIINEAWLEACGLSRFTGKPWRIDRVLTRDGVSIVMYEVAELSTNYKWTVMHSRGVMHYVPVKRDYPLNEQLHTTLLALGFTHAYHASSFEDDGDPENGPHICGGPAFDEYESPTRRVIVSEEKVEVDELRDPQWDAFCDAAASASQG